MKKDNSRLRQEGRRLGEVQPWATMCVRNPVLLLLLFLIRLYVPPCCFASLYFQTSLHPIPFQRIRSLARKDMPEQTTTTSQQPSQPAAQPAAQQQQSKSRHAHAVSQAAPAPRKVRFNVG